MKFGVMFFASSEEALGEDKYHLVIESAKFADRHGFSSVWVPERHFTEFGSLFPNPAILQAALARETQSVRLCAGSVVLPLHNPLRIVEEWSMVDNLSGGRVGVSFAPGWNPNDFAFFPNHYPRRHQVLFEGIQNIRHLWKERLFKGRNGIGKVVDGKVFPMPVQEELPVWLTAANSPQSFEKAGELGTHLLTYLLDQTVEELAEKIHIYRQARRANGFDPEAGQVSIMLHTFVGLDGETVREQAREPYCQFIKSNIGLFQGLAQSRGESFDAKALSATDLDQFANYLYERFASSRGLIGTPESCAGLVQALEKAGVQEIACLLDFGPTTDLILENLPHLDRLRGLHASSAGTPRTGPEIGSTEATTPGLSNESPEGKVVDLSEWPKREPEMASGSPRISRLQVPPQILGSAVRKEMNRDVFYAQLNQLGAHFDSRFRGVEHLWIGDREAVGRVVLPSGLESTGTYQEHPAYLDACLQVFAALLLEDSSASESEPALYLPVGFKSFRAWEALESAVWSHATLSSEVESGATTYVGTVRISNGKNRVAAEMKGLRLERDKTGGAFATLSTEESGSRNWLYDLSWEPRPEGEQGAALEPGKWLILADDGGVGQRLAEEMKRSGHQPLIVRSAPSASGNRAAQQDSDLWEEQWIDPEDPAELQRLMEEALSTSRLNWRGIIHLWALDLPSLGDEGSEVQMAGQKTVFDGALAAVRALLAAGFEVPKALWFVTRGAQAVKPGKARLSVTQSPLWGWARTLPLEESQLWRGLVDLDPEASLTESLSSLYRALARPDAEDQIAFRQGERFVLRLRHAPNLPEGERTMRWDPEGAYLITGGLGSFGLKMARWMIEHGARNLVLVGRSAPTEMARDEMEGWQDLVRRQGGTRELHVITRQVDVSKAEEVAALFETLGNPPLRGIIHAAGIAGEQLIHSMTFEHLGEMFGPKVLGTMYLFHQVTGLELDFFLNLSSLSPVWGTKGLAHYAAGNHFLDVMASYGQQVGVPIVTINVGPMAGGGIASSSEEVKTALTRVGLRLMPSVPTLAALDRLLASGLSQKILADVDWSIFKRLYESTGQGHLLESIQILEGTLDGNTLPPSKWLEELASTRSELRTELMVQRIQAVVARVMKMRDGQVPAQHQGFFDLGMDSLMVLELKNRLQKALGRELPATLAFDYPTIEKLSEVLLELLFPTAGEVPEAAEKLSPGEPTEASFTEEVQQLSDEELAAIIDAELGALVP